MSGPLHRCTSCKAYTLAEACPHCSAKAISPKPAKFSPEDNYGKYRRDLKRLDKAKGTPEGK
ncbi:MAG TPA: RNA-protein complex protein Nop10 [Candidatus Thermoplasmatota archaeon]|nr:RNA-protein complex protein Nop10 [Candidatus Thermoplasmatota archaeon]